MKNISKVNNDKKIIKKSQQNRKLKQTDQTKCPETLSPIVR